MIFKKMIILLPVILALSSCIGGSIDISMRRDGSGRITMEYQVPIALESLGRLDGNQNWPSVPVGRGDWERTISRIEGARLVSFSSRERGQDNVFRVAIDFKNEDTLLRILGRNASSNNNELKLVILRNNDLERINSDLINLLKTASGGKRIKFTFEKAGSISNLNIRNSTGEEILYNNSMQIVPTGRKVSFECNTTDIFDFENGLEMQITW